MQLASSAASILAAAASFFTATLQPAFLLLQYSESGGHGLI